MKWIYGKQDWKLTEGGDPAEICCERGLENCYLMTNGLGGFSSLTMTGAAARNDHAFLMACVQAPNHRYNLVHRLKEELIFEEDGRKSSQESVPENGQECSQVLSTQEFADREPETGCRYLTSFSWEDAPVWRFLADGVEIVKEAGLEHGANRAALRYAIRNRSRRDAVLRVTPFYQFVPKGKDMGEKERIVTVLSREAGSGVEAAARGLVRAEYAASGCPELYLRTNGTFESIPRVQEMLYYRYDACDGRRETGRTQADHRISLGVPAGESRTLEIVFETEGSDRSAGWIITGMKERRKALRRQAHFQSETAAALAAAADQFVSRRDSTNGETILAGYPFFEDWGRDTMIALPGVCLSTGRYETARNILRTFAVNERDGLMPNLFPEGGNEPMYNTADAALLFINCVYLYYKRTQDAAFAEEMYPVMERIINGYMQGTRFGIHMDEDGLIAAGQGLDQVTWMDVRVGEILPTPRHGKPVEINAYWYNALRIMEELRPVAGDAEAAGLDRSAADGGAAIGGAVGKPSAGSGTADCGPDYGALAERVKRSFSKKFWDGERGCLRDVLLEGFPDMQKAASSEAVPGASAGKGSGNPAASHIGSRTGAHAPQQLRCNQIWAVSLPFTMLDREKERRIVETVFEKLYTPYGLRTLEKEDEEFHPFYGGPMEERDMAYHQGTVWVFPMGAYYLAYLKVHDHSEEAKRTVREQLETLEPALREGCIGQLPEIYDGENPVSSKGCFAQAWSVGELLRVYEALEGAE